MADTMGHSATPTRDTSVVIGFCVLAVAPQIFELIWSIGSNLLGWGAGRGPLPRSWSHMRRRCSQARPVHWSERSVVTPRRRHPMCCWH